MAERLRVGIAGTGAAAQEFIEAIQEYHPFFEIVEFYGYTSAGKKLKDVELIVPVNEKLQALTIKPFPKTREEVNPNIDVFFSALKGSTEQIKEIEGLLASQKATFSTTSAWRYEPDVPIIITEVNSEQVELIKQQQKNRGWKGYILPGPNCTVVGPLISLKALGIKPEIIDVIYAASEQAVSGAGRDAVVAWQKQRTGEKGVYDGKPPQFDRNIRPKIDQEQEKVRKEMKKIFGYEFNINPKCTRVPVEFGHMVIMFVQTKEPFNLEQAVNNLAIFNAECKEKFGNLPSSPKKTVELSPEYGPQPFFDAEKYGGMCTFIGQLEQLEGKNGLSYIVLSHNLKKGAAKGSVQVAEFMHEKGYL